jgi:hypothetical protein
MRIDDSGLMADRHCQRRSGPFQKKGLMDILAASNKGSKRRSTTHFSPLMITSHPPSGASRSWEAGSVQPAAQLTISRQLACVVFHLVLPPTSLVGGVSSTGGQIHRFIDFY